MRRDWSIRAAVAAAFLAAALTGCVQIPDSGPVHTDDNAGVGSGESEGRYVPRGPQEDESGPDIVTHFLEAMTASPMSATVAREFLTKSAADGWSPEGGYLVYASKTSPEGASDLSVTLSGVMMFDSRGRWIGTPPGGTRDVRFAMEHRSGEWRIASAPDVLMVTANWFAGQTLPLSIYYFDPAGRTLVPEPVFVPQGDQMPTLLIRALLAGPPDRRLERTFVPDGISLNLSVTVSQDGIAEIPLAGDLSELPVDTLEKMQVQFAWALRQVPSISEIRITVGGQPLPLPGGSTEFSVNTGSNYDPAGTYARGELYGLSGGFAVRVLAGEAQRRIEGPFGQRQYGLRDVSVDLDASQIAGVTTDRQRVILSSVTGADDLRPQTVLSDGVHILKPAWDNLHRMWVVDRRPAGAVVSVVVDGQIAGVDVPGITGKNVTDILVSRDGTRIVATIRGRGTDRIVVARTFAAGPRSTLHATHARTIVRGDGERLRIRDLGWSAPTEVYYLKTLAGRQAELRSAIVDGSPSQFDPAAGSGKFGELGAKVVSSPRPSEEEPSYLLDPAGDFEPIVDGSPSLVADVSTLHYVG